jgi:hypothetical protein
MNDQQKKISFSIIFIKYIYVVVEEMKIDIHTNNN